MALIDASQLDDSPVEWTVQGVIPRTGHGILWGASTAGKSLLALDLALAVNSGTPWLGHQVQHPGAVAYLCGEGLAGIGIRLTARQARQQADDTAAVAAMARDHGDAAARAMIAALPRYDSSRIKVMTEAFPCYFDRSERPTQGMARALAQLSAIEDLELVIVDTLADHKGQLSLANSSSAGRITQGLKHLASELDVFVLAIAHPTADGRKMFGAESLFNSCDTVIQVEPDEVAAPGALRSATVSSRKSRDDAPFEPFGYQIVPCQWDRPAEDEDGNQIPGEMITIKSATVQRIDQAKPPAPEPARQGPPLPVLQPVERPRKRNGIRQDRGGLHSVPDLPAAPGQRPLGTLTASADRRREIVAAVLRDQCTFCGRPGGGAGCDPKMGGPVVLLGRSLSGPLYACHDRVLAAAIAGRISESDLDSLAS